MDYWYLHQASQSQLWLIAYISFWEWGYPWTAVTDERKLREAAPKLMSVHPNAWAGPQRVPTPCFGTLALVPHLKQEKLLKHSAQCRLNVIKRVKLWESLQVSKKYNWGRTSHISLITHWIKTRVVKKLSPKQGFAQKKNSKSVHRILLLLLLVLEKF